MLIWRSIFHPFDLFVFLNLKCVTCRHHRLGLSFSFERERGREREKEGRKKGERGGETDRHQFVVPLWHSLVDSCLRPDEGSNPQPGRIRMTL